MLTRARACHVASLSGWWQGVGEESARAVDADLVVEHKDGDRRLFEYEHTEQYNATT